ncbi:hypothetical protein [Frankia sp. QA3]|nr:hypothetical protein [Frankia sp. QA3]EIV92499.1 hypothetical protein FraQA3DRAFT_2073 [Frankia sp. QA3]
MPPPRPGPLPGAVRRCEVTEARAQDGPTGPTPPSTIRQTELVKETQ